MRNRQVRQDLETQREASLGPEVVASFLLGNVALCSHGIKRILMSWSEDLSGLVSAGELLQNQILIADAIYPIASVVLKENAALISELNRQNDQRLVALIADQKNTAALCDAMKRKVDEAFSVMAPRSGTIHKSLTLASTYCSVSGDMMRNLQVALSPGIVQVEVERPDEDGMSYAPWDVERSIMEGLGSVKRTCSGFFSGAKCKAGTICKRIWSSSWPWLKSLVGC